MRKPVRADDSDCKLKYECNKRDGNGSPVPRNLIYTRKPIHKRNFFYGFYEDDIPVVIVRIESPIETQSKKEIEREYRIIKELNLHENFIRHFSYEKDQDFM